MSDIINLLKTLPPLENDENFIYRFYIPVLKNFLNKIQDVILLEACNTDYMCKEEDNIKINFYPKREWEPKFYRIWFYRPVDVCMFQYVTIHEDNLWYVKIGNYGPIFGERPCTCIEMVDGIGQYKENNFSVYREFYNIIENDIDINYQCCLKLLKDLYKQGHYFAYRHCSEKVAFVYKFYIIEPQSFPIIFSTDIKWHEAYIYHVDPILGYYISCIADKENGTISFEVKKLESF